MTTMEPAPATAWKLWIYTNYDCNLSCRYCVAESTPRAPRRAIGLANARRLVDEALELDFSEIFFTGGEPFILDEIYEMLAYAAERVQTTVLTNAMLFNDRRLSRLQAAANCNLTVQVSLDGGQAGHHDAFRGPGTWARTVEGIKRLQANGFKVRLSSTETPANRDHMDELHAFRRGLGIGEADHFVRPLARRGFSEEGLVVGTDNLVPEITAAVDGVYWHPLASPGSEDMLVTPELFPLETAVARVQEMLAALPPVVTEERIEFT